MRAVVATSSSSFMTRHVMTNNMFSTAFYRARTANESEEDESTSRPFQRGRFRLRCLFTHELRCLVTFWLFSVEKGRFSS